MAQYQLTSPNSKIWRKEHLENRLKAKQRSAEYEKISSKMGERFLSGLVIYWFIFEKGKKTKKRTSGYAQAVVLECGVIYVRIKWKWFDFSNKFWNGKSKRPRFYKILYLQFLHQIVKQNHSGLKQNQMKKDVGTNVIGESTNTFVLVPSLKIPNIIK